MKHQNSMAAVILAGGENSRMHGEKKVFMSVEGRSLLEHLLETFQGLLPVHLSVEKEEPYRKTGLPLIVDHYPKIGPMGGICSALETCSEDAVFVTACDMSFLQTETVQQLMEKYWKSPGQITVSFQEGKIYPFPGIYPKTSLPALQQAIQSGSRSLRRFLETQEVQYLTLKENDPSIINLNTPLDLVSRASGRPLELEDAVSLLRSVVSSVTETETVDLGQTLGRVLAEDLIAPMDQPPFPRSPLDGYALRAVDSAGADREHPVTLRVVGKIYAGQVFDGRVGEGECVRIMTGAPIPEGADTVIRQEDTDYGSHPAAGDAEHCSHLAAEDTDYGIRPAVGDVTDNSDHTGQPTADVTDNSDRAGQPTADVTDRSDSQVQIYTEQRAYENYCFAGEDYRKGTVLLSRESRITAASAALAAGAGRTQLRVYRQPRVAVISTGDETVFAGESLSPGKIYDTNLPFVTGRLAELGGCTWSGMHCADDADLVAGKIRELARDHDLIVTTGGVSVGEKDIMHAVMEKTGGKKLFWKVKLKPGAPTLAFLVGETLVICLTGNPYGVMVNLELLVRPVLEKMSRGVVAAGRCGRRRLLQPLSVKAGKRRFLKGMADEKTVRPAAGSQAAGTISAMAQANCYIELSPDSPGNVGDMVWVHYL